MLNFFRSKPLIDDASCEWIFDTFSWALTHFDHQEFFLRTRLIQPTNDFFPGNIDSRHGMAETIFNHVVKYAGLSHWPLQLQAPQFFNGQPPALLYLSAVQRDSSAANTLPVLVAAQPLAMTYNPQQAAKPGDLASSYAHHLAQHVVAQSQQLPSGGDEYFNASTEIVAIFMGFGVMMANSAYTFRGGCGSCYNAQANRQATLSEDNVIFALALFCRLKGIPTGDATRNLKGYLKRNFKQALKQIDREPARLQQLLALK
ncbi:Putative orphan protein [Moritella viscosa]|uniref:hypothetical protein n=1 Tax=Moritella viscosa TaxID=80854 RepID=UPI000508F6F0|nr:hypothetical protein [Moritella viscosa]CED60461.1 putative uncharacterized protein [Moritella viscosa]SHO13273.1 Putative orphan protein [Moritella viscosa]SHO23287.1 Putative orphan protein [Moritella viscosa]